MASSIDRRTALRTIGIAVGAAAVSRAAALAAATGAIRTPRGYFALQPGHAAVLAAGSAREVSDSQLALPSVTGLTIRARWTWLAPQRDAYDFAFLERHAERCHRLGKNFKLLVMTGRDCAPQWLGGAWHAGAPTPWSPELRSAYAALTAKLGERFATDERCVGVHITGPTFPSAEMHPAPGLDRLPGYSPQAMAEAWQASIDAYAAAFPVTAACLSISVKPPAPAYLAQVLAYGRKHLNDRLAVQHNALKASTHPGAGHHRMVAQLASEGVTVGFEMVCAAASNPFRFGSVQVMDGVAIGRAAGGVYWDIYPPDLAKLT